MARALLSLLSVAGMLCHAIFGCCVHHEHAERATAAASTAAETGCHCCHHAPAAQPAADEHAPANHDGVPAPDCDEGRCAFSASLSRVEAPAPDAGAWIDAASMATLASALALALVDRAGESPGDQATAPPLRRHLSLRVLVI